MPNLLRRSVQQHSHERQRELLLEAQNGNSEAKNELIVSNIPFAMNVATKIFFARNLKHIELDDLIQAGCFGLERAINKFDLTKFGNHFLTYASYWIKQFIDKEIHYSRAYRVPLSVQRLVDRGELKNKETLNAVLNFQEMLVADHHSGGNREEGGYDFEGDHSPSGIFDTEMLPDERVEHDEELHFLQEAIDSLDERPRRVLRKKLSGMPLTDIGKEEGCSRTVIRKICVVAEEEVVERVQQVFC